MLPAEQSYFSIFFFAWKQYGEYRCRLFFTFFIYPEELFNKITKLATAQNKIQIITRKKQPSRD